MANQIDPLQQFKFKIRNLIREESQRSREIKLAPRAYAYAAGQQDAMVYSIESGQIKLVLTAPEGREYVLGIRTAGDIFGELCLSGQLTRGETAVAMQDALLKAIYYSDLLKILKGESLLEGLIQYMGSCISQQQEAIGSLLIANSEQRLAQVLLQLGSVLGALLPHGTTVVPRVRHEDLAAMVGTTRSRVGLFLKNFQERGLVAMNANRSLTIQTEKLKAFAAKSASPEDQRADVGGNDWLQRALSFSQLEAQGK